MAKQVTETPSRLSQVISDRMEERGVSIKQLSERTDIVYEHTRRIVRGESIPSKFTLKAVCDVLGLPYKELLDMANADKMQQQYGDLPLSLAGKDPTLEPMARIWVSLTEAQQQDLIAMAQNMVRRTKAARG